MFCSISGSVPEQPVVSTKSGHLFEKSLVQKYVKETGKCPVTGEALGEDDLLDLNSSKTVKPRPSPATSIPGLLGMFHDEWDALMLETHTLRQSLHTVRQELSHALYMHDAATRVIARLVKERDEARSALQNVKASIDTSEASKRAPEAAPVAEAGADGDAAAGAKRAKKASLPNAVTEELQAVNVQLSKARKKRVISPTLATQEQLESGMGMVASHPLHQTRTGGIVSIDLNPASPHIVATAGLDSSIQIFDTTAGRLLGSLTGHSKRLTQLAYASSSVILSSSADKTARIWSGEGGEYSCAAILKDHSAEVTGITVHPSQKYFVTGGADATWCFYDIEQAECLRQVTADDPSDKFTAVQFHPDGLILGAGTPGMRARACMHACPFAQPGVAWSACMQLPCRGTCGDAHGRRATRGAPLSKSMHMHMDTHATHVCASACNFSDAYSWFHHRCLDLQPPRRPSFASGRSSSRRTWRRLRGTQSRSAGSRFRKTATCWRPSRRTASSYGTCAS